MKSSLPALLLATLTVAAKQPPNIILIYADDLGYGDVSCNGATRIQTPNIDRLAREGMSFKSAYATSSTCTPSRYSLLTGTYAFRQKGTDILQGDAPLIIDPKAPTLPSALAATGYRTGIVGKWHLGLGAKEGPDWNGRIAPGPNEVGFGYSHIMAATGDRVPCVYVENGSVVNLDPQDPISVSYQHAFPGLPTGVSHRKELEMNYSHGHNQAVINGISRIGYMKGGTRAIWNDQEMADHFTGRAVSFIRESADRPFFLFFATHDVHVPRVPHPRFVGKSGMGPRGDVILQCDWQVGRVLETLDEMGIADKTLVVFSSDNGPVLDDGYMDDASKLLGAHRPAGPFRGGKYSAFEGGTRVPTFARWPGVIAAGGTSDALISQVDFPRTFAKIAGWNAPDTAFPDSQDMSQALLGVSVTGRDNIVLQAYSGEMALRAGNWKVIVPSRGKPGKPLLFDLAADPGEKTDLAAESPDKARELAAILEKVENGLARPRP